MCVYIIYIILLKTNFLHFLLVHIHIFIIIMCIYIGGLKETEGKKAIDGESKSDSFFSKI